MRGGAGLANCAGLCTEALGWAGRTVAEVPRYERGRDGGWVTFVGSVRGDDLGVGPDEGGKIIEALRLGWRRAVLGAAVAMVVLVVAFYLVGGWYFSTMLYKMGLSAQARRAARPSYPVRVINVGSSAITLEKEYFYPAISQPGVWGIEWRGGYGELGTILSSGPFSVTRRFHIFSGRPARGTKAAVEAWVYPLNPRAGLGLGYQDVTFQGPLGRYPAWVIPAKGTTWAITVHGISLSRLDCMKIVPTLHAAGMPVMMTTYRNDPGAPPSPNGLIGYGATEWADLAAAVRYAMAHGAHHVVLVGYSMGGGVVTSFLEHSSLANNVSGVILDAPMLNFSATVDYGASLQRLPLVDTSLPPLLVGVAKWFATLRYGVHWRSLDYFTHIGRVHAPILLFQGMADLTVPPSTSTQLAAVLGTQVTYVQTPKAGHLASWNLNPTRYDRAVTDFLATKVLRQKTP